MYGGVFCFLTYSASTETKKPTGVQVTGQGYLAGVLITEKLAFQDKAIQNFIIIQIRTYRGPSIRLVK